MKRKEAEMLDMPNNLPFLKGQRASYAGHGVVKILELREEELLGQKILLYTLLAENGASIKVPFDKAAKNGLRAIGTGSDLKEVIGALQGAPPVVRGTWRARAEQYRHKIGSGDLREIAGVVCGLYKRNMPSVSYSARALYERAFELLLPEVALLLGGKTNAEALEYLSRESGKKFDYDADSKMRADVAFVSMMAKKFQVPQDIAQRLKPAGTPAAPARPRALPGARTLPKIAREDRLSAKRGTDGPEAKFREAKIALVASKSRVSMLEAQLAEAERKLEAAAAESGELRAELAALKASHASAPANMPADRIGPDLRQRKAGFLWNPAWNKKGSH